MTSDSRPTTIEELAPLALTFDDVLLQPVESNVIPSQVKTTTRVSRNISIAIPARQRGDGHRHRDPDGGRYGA